MIGHDDLIDLPYHADWATLSMSATVDTVEGAIDIQTGALAVLACLLEGEPERQLELRDLTVLAADDPGRYEVDPDRGQRVVTHAGGLSGLVAEMPVTAQHAVKVARGVSQVIRLLRPPGSSG